MDNIIAKHFIAIYDAINNCKVEMYICLSICKKKFLMFEKRKRSMEEAAIAFILLPHFLFSRMHHFSMPCLNFFPNPSTSWWELLVSLSVDVCIYSWISRCLIE